MKEFDEEALSQHDGKDGRPCYIAHGGRVIDVSSSKLWKTGTHMKRHPAGTDLTAAIGAAPHQTDVLDKFPQVGIFKKKAAEPFLPAPLASLMERVPFLQRHPHPMVVHFPMVFSMMPFLFYLLYLVTGERSFEVTALHLSLIHISEPTRLLSISYAVFCLKKKTHRQHSIIRVYSLKSPKEPS